jgi:hypothetical protein
VVRKECREIAMKGTSFCCVMMHSRPRLRLGSCLGKVLSDFGV